MSDDTLRFVLQIVTVFVGGSAVQLTIFLLKRRAELRSLDSASDSSALNSANAYISTLQAGDKVLRDEMRLLKLDVKNLEKALDDERKANSAALDSATREVLRYSTELGRVRADLSVAQAQIAELSAQLYGRHGTNRPPAGQQ